MNISHTLPLSRSTWLLAALMGLLLAALTISPTLLSANSPPETPSSVTVTRSDGMLTATWPAVSGATGYHVRYSSDGKRSWATAATDHPNATIDFSVKNTATYVVAVRARNTHGDSAWRNSEPSGPFVQTNPPEAPSSVTLTRSVGSVTATWPAVSGATDYHVTYTWNGGKTWTLAAIDYKRTRITISNASNVSTYVFAVRARNSAGYSGWRNSDPIAPIYPPVLAPFGLTAKAGDKSVTLKWRGSSESTVAGYEYQYRQAPPAPGWSAWIPVPNSTISTTSFTKTGLTNDKEYRFKLRTVNADGAGPPAPQNSPYYVAATPFSGVTVPTPPGPPPPLAPESVTVTRADGTLTATWPDSERAYAYHVAYTSDGGSSWTLAALYHPGTTITIDGVSNSATYVVAVRARGDNGDSDWTRSAPIAPLTPAITFTNVTATTATLNLANNSGQWTWKRDSGSCSSQTYTGSQTTLSLTGLSKGTSYTYKAYSNANCSGSPMATATLTTLTPSLAAVSNVGTSTLTLALSNWSISKDGSWYYRISENGQSFACTGPVSSATANASYNHLTAGNTYSITAYSGANCTTEIATTQFSITNVSVENLGETTGLDGTQVGQLGNNNKSKATGFTTGSNVGGYTLDSVTVSAGSVLGSPTSFTVAIHEASSNNPATTATYTLSGSAPTGVGTYTYTCSGSCDLDPGTTYFLVLSATGPVGSFGTYEFRTSTSDDETNTPSNAGWSIANFLKHRTNNGNWSDDSLGSAVLLFKVSANLKTQGASPNMNVTLSRGD